MFGRPKIPDNARFDAGGMQFEVRSPMREHHIAYRGNACVLGRPLDLLDPRAAFTQNPHVPARVELSYTAQFYKYLRTFLDLPVGRTHVFKRSGGKDLTAAEVSDEIEKLRARQERVEVAG